jgi:hypothetical protein
MMKTLVFLIEEPSIVQRIDGFLGFSSQLVQRIDGFLGFCSQLVQRIDGFLGFSSYQQSKNEVNLLYYLSNKNP